MQQLGVCYIDRFFSLDNDSLDTVVRDIKIKHPNCGEVYASPFIGLIPKVLMIVSAKEFTVEFILCHAQIVCGISMVIINLFIGASSYTLA